MKSQNHRVVPADPSCRMGGLAPEPPDLDAPLFASTSQRAGVVAARFASDRYRQILELLTERPRCLFQIAAGLGCGDNQISGRFTELLKANLIQRTGIRRPKPQTGCHADEYQLTLMGIAHLAALRREAARDN